MHGWVLHTQEKASGCWKNWRQIHQVRRSCDAGRTAGRVFPGTGSAAAFSEYTVTVQAEGYRSVEVSAIDVFANVTALQEIRMEPLDISQKEGTENIVVPPNTLWEIFHQRFRKMR